MAKAQIILGEVGGGSLTLSNLSVQGKTPFYTLSGNNQSYTPNEDCIIAGNVNGLDTAAANIKFNGNIVYAVLGDSRIGYASSTSSAPDTYGIFCPKGTEVSTLSNSGSATFNIKFYSL